MREDRTRMPDADAVVPEMITPPDEGAGKAAPLRNSVGGEAAAERKAAERHHAVVSEGKRTEGRES